MAAKKAAKTKWAANVVWFEIPAEDLARAKKFYRALFGWNINPFPNSPVAEYEHIDTGGPDASPDGGLLRRVDPEQRITNYINVPSIAKFAAKIEKLGGSICKPKTAVPGMGYFAICKDTEDNTFAIWEMDPKTE